jgi:hypothetical protein
MDLVSNEPLRAVFRASGLTLYEVAARAHMDDTSVGRALGLYPLRDKRRANQGWDTKLYFNKRMTYETAAKLCRALGADPVDVGV